MKKSVVIILICIGLIAAFFLWNVKYQHGTSRDIVQGYDNGIFWHHAYLKNDHNTAYCFDDERFIPILEQSQQTQKEVLVTYEKYIGRGLFCSAGGYERVVITNVEILN